MKLEIVNVKANCGLMQIAGLIQIESLLKIYRVLYFYTFILERAFTVTPSLLEVEKTSNAVRVKE